MLSACNFGKGKWVVADNRPLYSGFGCKQWLSGMWACRLTQRTDFAYEKLKWQPKDCKMDEFTGAEFLKRMQDKTLAFVGDSLGRHQFQSLMCMMIGDEEMPDVEDGLLAEGFSRIPSLAGPTTVAAKQSDSGISLALPLHAECFGVLGPNGAGKTSFIKMMIGLVKPKLWHSVCSGSGYKNKHGWDI